MKQKCHRFKLGEKNIYIVAINRPISNKENTHIYIGCTSVTAEPKAPPKGKCGATGSVRPDLWTHLQHCKHENVSRRCSHFL